MRIHAQCRAYICVAHLLLQHWQGDSRFRKFGSKTMSEGVEPDIFMRRLRIGWRPYFTQLSRQRGCIPL